MLKCIIYLAVKKNKTFNFDYQLNKQIEKFKKLFHKLLRTKVIYLAGIALKARHPGVSRIVRNQLYRGSYERNESILISKYLRSSDTVVEIGCGIGFIGCLCGKISGSERVYSYEANPDLEAVIRANYALNNISPSLTMSAVSQNGQEVVLNVAENQISTSAIYRDGVRSKRLIVRSISLNKIINTISPSALIMDVEGLEVDLLNTSIDLRSVRLIIAETHPHIVGKEQISEMNTFLEKSGFQITETQGKVVVYERI